MFKIKIFSKKKSDWYFGFENIHVPLYRLSKETIEFFYQIITGAVIKI